MGRGNPVGGDLWSTLKRALPGVRETVFCCGSDMRDLMEALTTRGITIMLEQYRAPKGGVARHVVTLVDGAGQKLTFCGATLPFAVAACAAAFAVKYRKGRW